MNEKLADLIKQLHGRDPVLLEFTKVNGEIRRMEATLHPDHLPKVESVVVESSEAKTSTSSAVRVFDVKLNAWRSFTPSRLISVNGEKYEITE